METTKQPLKPHEASPQAQRAVRIIYIAMAIMILLPVLVIWLTGAIRVEGS